MPNPTLSIVLGLLSALAWGTGDFFGGLGSRRANALVVTAVAQTSGLILIVVLALTAGQPAPELSDLGWGAAAGLCGVIGIASLYRALAIGQMGIVAPITAVLSAGIPAVYGALVLGAPAALTLAGFGLALIAIALISSAPREAGRPAGLGLALISGIGFGAFLILITRANGAVALWALAAARATSATVSWTAALVNRASLPRDQRAWAVMLGAGVMDALGNALYTFAARAGRIDVAAVLSSLYPVSTIALALTILHERLRRPQVVGIVIAVIAIVLVAL